MAYYLGIDGGGSKTTCAVGDDVSILARAIAGPSNIVRVGEAEARRSLHQAVTQACAAVGISPKGMARTCMGGAGVGSPEVISTLRRILAELLSTSVLVTGDMQIALEAAFPNAPGIVVIAGTGSIIYGRDAAGNTVRAGGWGFAVSDEGSAHWIGRNAVAMLFRAYDRAQAETGSRSHLDLELFRMLRETWNVVSIDDLVRAVNAVPAPNFAALFPGILACANADDELSRQVLTCAASELAQLASVIIPRLFPEEELHTRIPLAMVGGVFRHSDLVRKVFYNEIKKLYSAAEILPQVVEPVEGALRLARGEQS
ncbi:MAG: BadF/BadG/BcrA/BcrD ATPase family protein [Candidatus Sulfotelmatobacter sp.]